MLSRSVIGRSKAAPSSLLMRRLQPVTSPPFPLAPLTPRDVLVRTLVASFGSYRKQTNTVYLTCIFLVLPLVK